ncbi:MAG: hypothetical protein M3N50_01030 [Pseudomonadota bacterium]|nr:hypothetical protein [Pseudomonadota bacterium]
MRAFAVVGLIACLGCLQAFADCAAPPTPPRPPDGATASREDMMSAMQSIRAYEAAVKDFQSCATRANSALEIQTANSAIDKLVGIADKFNYELNAFKKKSSQ